jgi:hypothetical protein
VTAVVASLANPGSNTGDAVGDVWIEGWAAVHSMIFSRAMVITTISSWAGGADTLDGVRYRHGRVL